MGGESLDFAGATANCSFVSDSWEDELQSPADLDLDTDSGITDSEFRMSKECEAEILTLFAWDTATDGRPPGRLFSSPSLHDGSAELSVLGPSSLPTSLTEFRGHAGLLAAKCFLAPGFLFGLFDFMVEGKQVTVFAEEAVARLYVPGSVAELSVVMVGATLVSDTQLAGLG